MKAFAFLLLDLFLAALLDTLVKEPLCNSPKYKFNDNRELTVDNKVAIAMRRLKLEAFAFLLLDLLFAALLDTLVKEPLCNSPKYKFNDNRELTVDNKVAIAMRMLKLGKSVNSIGNEIGTHSFTVDKVTRTFVEAKMKIV
uniref:Uncharacterized protein n=1 Tax=Daucus carota subsp. sativus TaxID=79200 RepID=A0A162B3C0_DAUCS